MITPDIKDLIDKVDSRYTLVVATAKRARQLVDGSPKQTKFNSDKAVTLAIHEIAEGKVTYTRKTDAEDNYSGSSALPVFDTDMQVSLDDEPPYDESGYDDYDESDDILEDGMLTDDESGDNVPDDDPDDILEDGMPDDESDDILEDGMLTDYESEDNAPDDESEMDIIDDESKADIIEDGISDDESDDESESEL